MMGKTLPLSLKGKSVLITGCSSGIGLASAKYLAGEGVVVFASVRKREDELSLKSLNDPNLVPLCPLDLTKNDDITGAFNFISNELHIRGIRGLYSIVNNAGGGFISPVELSDINKLRSVFETRVLGPVALLQEFLPLIREGNGRIVWIVTGAEVSVPFFSSLYICDSAVKNMIAALNIELNSWDIPVIMIKCGGINTPAKGKAFMEFEESARLLPIEKYELYSGALGKFISSMRSSKRRRIGPQEAAKKIFKALSDMKPELIYKAGLN